MIDTPRYVRVTVRVDDANTGELLHEVEIFRAEEIEGQVEYEPAEWEELWPTKPVAVEPPRIESFTFTIRRPMNDPDHDGHIYRVTYPKRDEETR